jgi:hypothetical protein
MIDYHYRLCAIAWIAYLECFTTADSVIIPIQCVYFALEGLGNY